MYFTKGRSEWTIFKYRCLEVYQLHLPKLNFPHAFYAKLSNVISTLRKLNAENIEGFRTCLASTPASSGRQPNQTLSLCLAAHGFVMFCWSLNSHGSSWGASAQTEAGCIPKTSGSGPMDQDTAATQAD